MNKEALRDTASEEAGHLVSLYDITCSHYWFSSSDVITSCNLSV